MKTKKEGEPFVWGFAHISAIVLTVLVLSALHYQTVSAHPLLHEVSQRLYYLPITYAAYRYGIRGGLGVALLSAAFFLPHVGLHFDDPKVYVNQYAEIIVFFLIGLATGVMSNTEKRERRRYEQTAEELGRAYNQLKETVDQLLLADRLASLGQISAAIVHEVRNPLASIKGAVQALESEIPTGHRKREFLDAINHEIDRLNRMATEFLQFARPRQPEMTAVQPNDVVRSVITLVAKEAARLNVRVITELDHHLPESRMDGQQIKQALLNLVINGLQAMSRGGDLEIATAQRDGALTISVRDHGPGIALEVRDRIFDPFVTTKDRGTGLGLAIAHRLVKQHDGTIRANDAPGGGSIFEIELPLNQLEKAKSAEVALSSPMYPTMRTPA